MELNEKTKVITDYNIDNTKFVIEITETQTEIESWIFHEHYGVKMLMFGYNKNQIHYEEFMQMVKYHYIEYAITYFENYMKEDK